MSRLRERLRGLVTARPWPFHPVLFAAYFVLFLYSANLDEAEFSDVLPVLIPVALATAVLLVAGGIVVRDVRRAGIVLSAAVVALLAYGHVGGLLEPTKIGPGYQQLSWGLFGLLALVVAWRAVGWIPRLTRILNVIALVLVIVPVVSIVPHELGRLSVAAARPGPGATASPGIPAAGGPDIYWFVFDRYPSASSLQLAYGLENPIFDELRSRGFYVADRSHANYQQTTFSVTSTFSAEFLDGRGHADIFGPTDVTGEFSRIENSNVGRFLKARGYFYAHIGSDFSPTRTSKIADVNHAYDGFSDFETAFVESTAVPGIARRLGILPSPWKRRYDWTTWELNLLDRLPPYPSPKFVFSHLLLPHPPYIFGRDGQFLDETANRGRAAKEQFEEQLTYTNTRLLAIIDRLLALPEDERPVIIVQADEGPYPAGLRDNTGHDWTKETPERREIKFGILNAWYLPGGRDIGLYPEITPVNTFRILFDAYFGTDLPLLPDESYSVNHPEPLTFPQP